MGELRPLSNEMDMTDWESRNIAVLQTTVAELVTVKEHQRKII